MYKCNFLLLSLVLATSSIWWSYSVAGETLTALNAKDFQLDFLRALSNLAEQRAEQSLNDYLQQLERNASYANYSGQLATALANQQLPAKVLLIKQLLDAQPHNELDLEHICVLRNLHFLGRLQQSMRTERDGSAQEMRQLRLHRLCQQFERPQQQQQQHTKPAPKPRLINEQTVGSALQQLNLTQSATAGNSLDLNQFGQQLYERVKHSGAEIIDNYVLILRGLLQDIIDAEHADLIENTTQLERVVKQLDNMLAIQDFYEKRQSVYAFLERHLRTDIEQLQHDSNGQQQHLNDQLLAQLKAKGLDLFVIFLFSNFEFLEQVHAQWTQLLPQSPSLLYDEVSRQLYDIQQLYEVFKLHTESEVKYEAYTGALRALHIRTVEQATENHHIFEMVNNAAQNVGSITFNMIKAKCKELL
ncbi:CG42369 [Drosophila busckii]|uniref:CG42369 n=1 Tax=Drosophila busckii TaxID=30019 RepID=A0A0M4E9V5_DROBS|nr:uncharacterized protein LOC108594391 [Drosophila busckii]ALC39064.1 CG42369 [Drosophila busckii]